MNNHFEFLKDLLFNKKHASLDDIEYNLSSAFLLNNWISGYKPEIIELLNQTANKTSSVFSTNKERLYNYYFHVIPKLKYSHLKYPKSQKKEKKTKYHDTVLFLAQNMEMSVKEIEYLVENDYIDIKKMKIE